MLRKRGTGRLRCVRGESGRPQNALGERRRNAQIHTRSLEIGKKLRTFDEIAVPAAATISAPLCDPAAVDEVGRQV